tara:strand:+ start:333 stop:836 length:504 start_codon:yes stop_codon:yes gene_type:complete
MFRVIISIGILLVVAACVPNRHAALERDMKLQIHQTQSNYASGNIKESEKYRQYMRQLGRHPEGPSHWRNGYYQGAYENAKLYEDGRRSKSLYEQIKSNSTTHFHNMVALEAQQNAAESRRRQAAFDQAIDNLLTVKQPTVSPPDPDRQLDCQAYNYGPHNQGFTCR